MKKIKDKRQKSKDTSIGDVTHKDKRQKLKDTSTGDVTHNYKFLL